MTRTTYYVEICAWIEADSEQDANDLAEVAALRIANHDSKTACFTSATVSSVENDGTAEASEE